MSGNNDVMECPEGFVPGWLDEDGNPQGCVNNGNGAGLWLRHRA